MSLQEIDRLIEEKKKEELKEEEYKGYQYISSFLEKNKLDSLEDYINMDIWEFIKCRYFINKKDSMDEISYIFDSSHDFFDQETEDHIRIFLGYLKKLQEEEELENVKIYLESEGKIESLKHFTSIKNKSMALSTFLLLLKSSQEKINLLPFIEEFIKNSSFLTQMINYYIAHERIKDFYSNVIVVGDQRISKKELEYKKEKALKELLKEEFDMDKILSELKEVKDYKKRYEKERRRKEQEINNLKEERKRLEKDFEKKEVGTFYDYARRIKDERIKLAFLKAIKEHNELYLKELLEKESNLKKDHKIEIELLLKEYQINKEDIDLEHINFTLEELKELLETMKPFEWDSKTIIKVIEKTTINRIKKYQEFLIRDLLPISFLKEHSELLEEENSSFNNLKENINFLKEKNISLKLFISSYNTLLIENNLLIKNIKLLEQYNLLEYLKEDDLSFLEEEHLEDKIILFEKYGYIAFLKEDLSLLNENNLEILEIYKLLEISITTIEELREILRNSNNIFLNNEERDEFLSNTSKVYLKKKEEN